LFPKAIVFFIFAAITARYQNNNGGTSSLRADLDSSSAVYQVFIGLKVNN